MAVVAVNIDPELYERVARRVRDGAYLDLDQFFALAARNQLALESDPEGLTRARQALDDLVATADGLDRPMERAGLDVGAQPHQEVTTDPSHKRDELVRRAELTIERFPRPDVDRDPNHLLWGQTNRVLPIAAGVRVLANLLEDSDDVPVATWHREATRVAMGLRDELRSWDERAKRPHGSRWATAFPEKKESSAERYVSQFLGAAVFLGFASITEAGEDARATLTTGGASWAGIPNPIFDPTSEPERTFSDEEVRVFLDHLHEFRIGEHRFLNTMAMLVADGLTRDEQNEAIARAYPRWTSVASTMRAGGIGRLGDLGLLERTRRGLKVDYRLSALAGSVGLPRAAEVVGR